jgi:hypothetical protein
MTAELDKVLNRHDRIERVAQLWKSMGDNVTDEQAIAASVTLADKGFEWTGSVLMFNGKPAKAEAVREHFAQSGYAFLLPPDNAAPVQKIEVDPVILASAKAGNKTAEGQLFLQVGKDRAKLAALLASADDDAGTDETKTPTDDASNKTPKAKDHKNNPFHKSNWSLAAQGKLIRAIGPEKAAAIAAAVGVTIGATKPNPNY